MNDAVLMSVILFVGMLFGLFANSLIQNTMFHIEKIKLMLANDKLFKQKQQEVADMRPKGVFHEWFDMPKGDGNTIIVCKKTGWCPSLKGFVPMSRIEAYLAAVKAEEEYKVFRNGRVAELAIKMNLDNQQVEKFVEDVFSIKKDYTLMKIKELQQELQANAAKANKL